MIDGKRGWRKPAIVSICGPSNAGKSQVAKATMDIVGPEIAARVPTDYFLLPRSGEGHLMWDWGLLAHRFDLPMGTETTAPDLDFRTFRRRSTFGGPQFTISPVMLCDAMLPFPWSDITILIEAPSHIRRARVTERDRRWGTRVAEWWEELEATWRAVARTIRIDATLDGTMSLGALAETVAAHIYHVRRMTMPKESAISIGTNVIALDGEVLGRVREVQDYYILVDQPDAHDDLEVPSNAVGELEDGVLRLTVNRSALSAVDDEETARHELEEEGG